MNILENLINSMYKQISNSAEPKVIGVNNGVYQVEFSEKEIKKQKNWSIVESMFLLPKIEDLDIHNKKISKIRINNLTGILIKNAKATDLMGFSPYFFGCSYLVSRNFVNGLIAAEVNTDEYWLNEVVIKDTQNQFYLMYVPMIPDSEIKFNGSLLFPEREYLQRERSYFKVQSFKDYQALIDKGIMFSFEKIMLPVKYKTRNIISIQGASNLFFSKKLLEKMKLRNLSSFIIPKRQIELVFE